jgi:hypothetical protein
VAPLSIIASIWMIEEQRSPIDMAALRERLAALVSALRSRNLWLVAGFLFLYYFNPGFGTPLYFHMTDRLAFSQGFIGLLSSTSAGGWILGGVLYTCWLHGLSNRAMLRLSILIGVRLSAAERSGFRHSGLAVQRRGRNGRNDRDDVPGGGGLSPRR